MKNNISARPLLAASLFYIFILLLSPHLADGQEAKNPENTADKNLKSAARINPSTLAMEFTMPFGAYPGRNGNSVPVSFSYSSKVWRMTQFSTRMINAATYYYHNPIFAEKTAAGWSSSLQAPRMKNSFIIYDPSGYKYSPHFQSMMVFPEQPFEYNAYTAMLPVNCHEIKAVTIIDGEEVESHTIGKQCTLGEVMSNYSMGATYQNNIEQDKRFIVKRYYITMPDGSSVEFRKDDNIYELCDSQNPAPAGCLTNLNASTAGTYLSVDGSRMRLEVGELQPGNQLKNVLYMPNGSRYLFPAATNAVISAEQFIDVDGNQVSYQSDAAANTSAVTDTMGREIQDPLPGNWFSQAQTVGTKTLSLKGINNQPLDYHISWAQLKTPECDASTTAGCGASVLEDDAQALKYSGDSGCEDGNPTALSNSLFEGDLDNSSLLVCGKVGSFSAARFNPVVLSEIELPDGTKYKFKYNIYGEITRIDYPTGGYEKFRYDKVLSIGYDHSPIFEQTNRGVAERWVSADGTTVDQHWTYLATGTTNYTTAPYMIKTTAPDGSRTERYLNDASSTEFGFGNVLSGMPYDEKSYDTAGHLRSRKLTEWTVKSTPVLWTSAQRDPRVARSVSIIIEGDKALATYSKTDYDDTGSTDPSYFSHLNAKESRSYHYFVIPKATAESSSLSWTTLESYLNGAVPSGISQTDYLYGGTGTPGDVYKKRGIIGLPVETRSLNPANTTDVLAKSQPVYDEAVYPTLDTNLSTTGWVDPLTLRECVNNATDCKRGKATTMRTWVKETNTWLETHAQYDNFGNLRKAWDASGDSGKFVETQYGSVYNYAYPTKIITPSPAFSATNDYGTTETSTSETTYDFTTGLSLSVKNDAGQITKTEYDSLQRPWRTYADNYIAPETQTVYGVPTGGQLPENQRFVKVRKQIDQANWNEATTWMDGMGRTVKSQTKDAGGDVFVETQYDNMGRAFMTTNPYRAGDTKLWNLTEFDKAGRVVQSRAPVANQDPEHPIGDILGTTSFDISTASGYVGTVVVSNDTSGRKSRSITNALGQLLRVDEPTATGGAPDTDLGTIGTPLQATSYTYDAYGKMVKVQQGTSQTRYFKYDSLGRLIRVNLPEQQTNASLDLADAYNTTGHWTAAFAYDVFGNVKRATDANGTNTISEYDRANRVIRRCYTKPNVTTTATECSQIPSADSDANTPGVYFTYDGVYYRQDGYRLTATGRAKGSLTQVRNGISTSQTTKYDDFGRATEYEQITDGVTYTSKYAYNFAGALETETYPSGRVVKNEFNADGDLLRVFGKANAAATEKTYANSFSYTAAGGISQMKLGNGKWETAKFNDRQQVYELGLGNSATDASVWKVNYDYGEIEDNGTLTAAKNMGNIARQTISFAGLAQPFVQTYRYDSLYRLKEAKETSGSQTNWTQGITYDRYGNRLTFASTVGATTITTTPTVDQTKNRFDLGQGFGYDKNGNIISDVAGGQTRNFIFNGENKQTEIRDPNIAVNTQNPDNNLIGRYFYDGEGKRVKKVTATETTVFVYSGSKLIQEYSTLPPPTNPSTNYTTTDHLGSPRVITDQLGAVKSRRDFMPFGEDLYAGIGGRTSDTAQRYATLQDDIRQKFTGYQKDAETNLDFAEARMYNNSHGRFTAVDPLLASGKSANPQSFNRYVYVRNQPLLLTDKSGRCPDDDPGCDDVIFGGWTRAYNWVSRTFSYGDQSVTTRDQIPSGLYNRLSNSDPLQNLNGARFQNIIDGDTDGLSRRLIGNKGPTFDSVVQQITDNYRAAQTIGELGLSINLGLLTLNPAGYVGGSSTVTTNRGIPLFGGTSSGGFSYYARQDAAIRANVAVENWSAANPNARPSVLIGAADIKSTGSVAMTEGPIPAIPGVRMSNTANRSGGFGTRTGCGNIFGACAEQRAANFLELNFRTRPENITFTQPFRPRTGESVQVCFNCRTFFSPNQFPNGY